MIAYEEFAARAARSSGRCFALVRHGRRPAIAEDDPTFGENLPLTEDGRAMALACGRALRGGPPPSEWAFLASRLLRTRLTAAFVAEGLGAEGAVVRTSDEASIPPPGISGIWVEDVRETFRHYEAEGSVPFTDRFFSTGRAEGYRPIAESTERALAWLRGADFGARCVLVCTHDVFLAALLQGLAVKRSSTADWVGFLQGCALFERPDGAFDAAFLVPDKTAWRNAFVQ